jgi:hypothetical protein
MRNMSSGQSILLIDIKDLIIIFIVIITMKFILADRLCGLVFRVPG